MIYLKVKGNCGNWQKVDPSLLVGDLKQIIDWFRKLAKNQKVAQIKPKYPIIKRESDLKTIRIKFDLESRPKSADNEKEYFVDCEMNNLELNKAADELKKELESYPERAVG